VRFDDIAARYAQDSKAQRSAAEVLLALADVRAGEDVLDVGCGTGALLVRLRTLTRGRVVGVDPSAGMLAAARREVPQGVELAQVSAEDLPYAAEFDLVVSNSALQWFRDPAGAFARFRRALRPGGRAAIQAPATARYAPEFVDAMEHVARDPRTRDTFAAWRSPWLWLETADAYAALVEGAGFDVRLARLDTLSSRETPDGALTIFGSAAQAGYLGAASYPAPLPAGYVDTAREIVRAHFEKLAAPDGKLELRFRRVFVAADAR
jgi:ubiquinone/menaquinone biosynthesis C-methylase UbiE